MGRCRVVHPQWCGRTFVRRRPCRNQKMAGRDDKSACVQGQSVPSLYSKGGLSKRLSVATEPNLSAQVAKSIPCCDQDVQEYRVLSPTIGGMRLQGSP